MGRGIGTLQQAIIDILAEWPFDTDGYRGDYQATPVGYLAERIFKDRSSDSQGRIRRAVKSLEDRKLVESWVVSAGELSGTKYWEYRRRRGNPSTYIKLRRIPATSPKRIRVVRLPLPVEVKVKRLTEDIAGYRERLAGDPMFPGLARRNLDRAEAQLAELSGS